MERQLEANEINKQLEKTARETGEEVSSFGVDIDMNRDYDDRSHQ